MDKKANVISSGAGGKSFTLKAHGEQIQKLQGPIEDVLLMQMEGDEDLYIGEEGKKVKLNASGQPYDGGAKGGGGGYHK